MSGAGGAAGGRPRPGVKLGPLLPAGAAIDTLILIVSLVVILAGSLAFTNALEHFGESLGLSTGVTGSVFAAIGTALPETAVPIVAFATGHGSTAHNDIGIGAILGAPLMLATLAFFLMGLMALFRRGPRGAISPEPTGVRRDVRFFLGAFIIAVVVPYVPHHAIWIRCLFATALVGIYAAYLWRTLRASGRLVEAGHGTESDAPLHAGRLGLPDNLVVQSLQLLAGVVFIVAGARGFVHGITGISATLGLSPLFLSLAIVPFATELPEKLNSLIWVAKGRDTLAVGNVSGAMVFQSSLLPAIGILATPWSATFDVRLAMGITLLAGAWLLVLSRLRRLPALALMLNGLAYAAYFVILLRHG